MAQLGKLVFAIKDSAGNALSSVSIAVRKQGAQVNGDHAGAQTTFTVNDPGAIVAGDTVSLNTGSTTRSVSSITATTVVVGGLGFNNAVDDDRITDVTLPTIYNDATGTETKSNPLTTDSAGEAFCWVIGGKYDAHVSGGGATTKLYTDLESAGAERFVSTVYGGSGSTWAWNFDTLRTLDSGDAVFRVAEAGTARFTIFRGGGFTSSGTNVSTISGPLTVSGALTASVGAAVTGAITATTTVTGGTGVIATTGNVQATAGNAIFKRALATQGTAFTITDANIVLSAGWGDTASFSMNGKDQAGRIQVTANGAGIAASPTVTFTYKDGAWGGGSTPIPVVCRGDEIPPTTAYWSISTFGDTTFAVKFVGLPVAGSTYWLYYIVMGR